MDENPTVAVLQEAGAELIPIHAHGVSAPLDEVQYLAGYRKEA